VLPALSLNVDNVQARTVFTNQTVNPFICCCVELPGRPRSLTSVVGEYLPLATATILPPPVTRANMELHARGAETT
jgi:hypothetical protein